MVGNNHNCRSESWQHRACCCLSQSKPTTASRSLSVMASLANLSFQFLCLLSLSPLLAGRAEDWQEMGTWVHSLTEAGYARDPKEEEISWVKPSNEWREERESGRQAVWLAQAGFSVSDGEQLVETAPEEQGNVLEARVGGEPVGGFQPSRIHSLTESAFAGGGRGGEGARVDGRSRGVELQQMESIFQPSRLDLNNSNDDERARESLRINPNNFLVTRYYPRPQSKSGNRKLQEEKKVGPKYLLADAANHTYLKLPMKELLRRLQSNKQLLREKIMHRQETKS